MSLIASVLVDKPIDFPCKNSRVIIEDNVGDESPIHIHFGKEPGYPRWKVRLSFDYDAFIQFCGELEKWDM